MDLTDMFEALIARPSPSRREGAVAAWVREFCTGLGYAVEEDEAARAVDGDAGNLLVRVPGEGQGASILVCAHLDTVETGDAPADWTREGDTYRSRDGRVIGADDKAGVACALALLQALREMPREAHGPVRVVFTVAEEVELLGARALPQAWLAGVDAAVALDHSDPAQFTVAGPAKEAMRLRVQGKAGHATEPERGINAAHLVARVVAALPSGRLDEASTCNLGVVRGGTALNVIPGEAQADYEVRSLDEARLDFYVDRAERLARGIVGAQRIRDPDTGEVHTARLDIGRRRCYRAYRHAPDALACRLVGRAMERAGLAPTPVCARGGSDAHVLNERGVPATVLGCGLHGAHGASERAEVAEMQACVRVLRALVQERP